MAKKRKMDSSDPINQPESSTKPVSSRNLRPKANTYTPMDNPVRPVRPPQAKIPSSVEDIFSEFGFPAIETIKEEYSPKEAAKRIKKQAIAIEQNMIDEEVLALKKIEQDRLAGLELRKDRKVLADEPFTPSLLPASSPHSKLYAMLKNPEDVKTAFALNEILKRKFDF